MPLPEIIDVNASNVAEAGFFCAMSKRGMLGYKEKLEWLQSRFGEGLRIKMISKGGRGFIEYIPGEHAWRGIDAPGYMVIHCMWVVGRSRAHGCGRALLEMCIREARALKMHGVAAVSARATVGLVNTDFFVHNGFKVIDSTAAGMDLVALKFHRAPKPAFTDDGPKRARALGSGLTIISSPQCPYTYEGAKQLAATARDLKVPAKTLRLTTAEQVRNQACSPYGSFEVVYNGEVVSHLFHCMSPKRLGKVVADRDARRKS
jgi:GNAT superfamily N-acetyltransferase